MNIPRIVIAGAGSGVGKTTTAVAIMAAMKARGLRVAPFKCGPDYLDPSYHRRASGVSSQNLDGWMMGREAVIDTFSIAAKGADIAIIEGMMGLFDGATPTSDEGSTAEIAKWLRAPVVIVADASGIARTVGAIAMGFRRFDPGLDVRGLICNQIGGRGHLDLLRASSPELPILGGLPHDNEISFPERHLGLFEASEASIPSGHFDSLGAVAADWIDLDEIASIARSAPPIPDTQLSMDAADTPPRCRIGIARDEAFHFYYEYNLARLGASGAELVEFSPVHDDKLPDVNGLYLGGGYPESMGRELAANATMRAQVQRFGASGGPIYAECGGLMYLARAIRVLDGTTYPMAGLFEADAVMRERLQAIGYAEVEATGSSFLGPSGMRWRGHQFRYSSLEPDLPHDVQCVFRVTPRWGGSEFIEGYSLGNVIASYVHAHWASNPKIAQHFVAACEKYRNTL